MGGKTDDCKVLIFVFFCDDITEDINVFFKAAVHCNCTDLALVNIALKGTVNRHHLADDAVALRIYRNDHVIVCDRIKLYFRAVNNSALRIGHFEDNSVKLLSGDIDIVQSAVSSSFVHRGRCKDRCCI